MPGEIIISSTDEPPTNLNLSTCLRGEPEHLPKREPEHLSKRESEHLPKVDLQKGNFGGNF